jgi:hypothetical protein
VEQRGDTVPVEHETEAGEAHHVKRKSNAFRQGAQAYDTNEGDG